MAQIFHPLNVQEVIRETADTVSIVFAIPSAVKEAFAFTAGQYITLKFEINGQEERRSYSMSSSPSEDFVKVSVKKVENGKVSSHINDHLKAGDVVSVSPPEGRFILKPDENRQATYYMLGAGSGITPLMSMIKVILEEEPKSNIFLLYGNRDHDCVIFQKEFEALLEKYSGQIEIEYIFSQSTKIWTGMKGRINKEILTSFLEKYPARSNLSSYYICGPGDMIDSASSALEEMGIDSKNIKREYFTSAHELEAKEADEDATGKIKAHLNGDIIEVNNNGKTITQQLMDAGHEPPFSCSSGSCATCIAKVISGEVEMEVCYALDDDEIQDGYILTCQACLTSDSLEITFDEV